MSMIYLDHNATTPVAPEVLEAMLPYFAERFHNPSAPYPPAEQSADAVRAARSSVARLVGADPRQITFTSGGSESITTALHSALRTTGRRRILISAVEHSAARRSAVSLGEVTTIGVDAEGAVDRATLFEELDGEVAAVSLMLANNETGVLTDIRGIGAACREVGAIFHLDAVQGPGKLPLDLAATGAHLASLSAHKLHGPKGCGALWIAEDAPFVPLVHGGPQESERRAGTENVPGVVGFGRAAELARAYVEDEAALARTAALRDRLESGLLERLGEGRVHGGGSPRLGNTTNVHFPGRDARTLLLLLAERGVLASAGSACNAQRSAPSPVLLAMGSDPEEAASSLRFSLGRHTTSEEIDTTLEAISEVLATLDALG